MGGEARRAMKRPVSAYLGGKWKIADWVISHFPAHRGYIEPFGGMGSVLLKKEPVVSEILNDVNDCVVNGWGRWLGTSA
jgi:DNA adenine methylase